MKNDHSISSETVLSEPTAADIVSEDADSCLLTPSKRVELWSGRLAMVGVTTTIAAIAFRATI